MTRGVQKVQEDNKMAPRKEDGNFASRTRLSSSSAHRTAAGRERHFLEIRYEILLPSRDKALAMAGLVVTTACSDRKIATFMVNTSANSSIARAPMQNSSSTFLIIHHLGRVWIMAVEHLVGSITICSSLRLRTVRGCREQKFR